MIDMWVKLMLSCSDERKLYERLAGHCCRLLYAHQLEDGRSHVCELSVLHFLYIVVNAGDAVSEVKNGKLADVAPTILKLMGIEQPAALTGEPLV